MRANAVYLVLTGTNNAIPATPNYIKLGATSATLDVSEDGEVIPKLVDGVEPSKKILSGIDSISGNLEMTFNYDTSAIAFGLTVGKPTVVEANSGDWTADTVVTAGTIVKGTTPNTDDLYCLVGGTTDSSDPDTSASSQGDEIVDNTVTWVVNKSRIKEATGTIKPCLELVAVEYEFVDCDGNFFYFRNLGCKSGSLGFNIEKKTVPRLSIDLAGSVTENSITDSSYTAIKDITGATEIAIDNNNDVSNSDLAFTVGASANYGVINYSFNIDTGREEQTFINKDREYNTGLRAVNGSMSGLWDEDIYKAMVGNDDSALAVSYDAKDGNRIEISTPTVAFAKKSPTFEKGKVANLECAYDASGTEAQSAVTYKIRGRFVDFQ